MARRDMAEQFFNNALNAIKESQSDLERSVSGYASGFSRKPPLDIIEDDLNITVKADLPGFRKENVMINISDAVLEITALFVEDPLPDGAYYLKNERQYNEINRVVELPAKIKINSASAEFTDGVLQITLPKLEKTGVNID
jgi:HSP20 family protein